MHYLCIWIMISLKEVMNKLKVMSWNGITSSQSRSVELEYTVHEDMIDVVILSESKKTGIKILSNFDQLAISCDVTISLKDSSDIKFKVIYLHSERDCDIAVVLVNDFQLMTADCRDGSAKRGMEVVLETLTLDTDSRLPVMIIGDLNSPRLEAFLLETTTQTLPGNHSWFHSESRRDISYCHSWFHSESRRDHCLSESLSERILTDITASWISDECHHWKEDLMLLWF